MLEVVLYALLLWLVLGLIDMWKSHRNKQEHPDGPGELQLTIKEIER